jgi:D-tyrosyl-tRNA(Tyr) deacylase
VRIFIQRVDNAQVLVEGSVVGKIEKGLVVLVGIKEGDTEKDALFLAEKLIKLRVMADEKGKMNLNLTDSGGSALIVSQFTLYADTSGGNRPSFIKAGDPKIAEQLYEIFISKVRESGIPVETGKFGSYMMIDVKLDGPVTILIDS